METDERQRVLVFNLGRMAYAPAWDLQRRLQHRLIRAKRENGTTAPLPHLLLFVEHPPVYTLGKSGDASNLLASDEQLVQRGATFHHVDRGGDITYHGPGQIVGYPLLDLDRFFTDIHRYLRELEETIILTCGRYGVKGGRIAGRTGVWVGPDDRGPERKICAMGIRCSRWVTMHGFALNVNTDLSYFSHIIPCGISNRQATSLTQEIGTAVSETEVMQILIESFAERFDAQVEAVPTGDVSSFLSAFANEDVQSERAT